MKMCPLRKGREELVACATYLPSSVQSGKRNWVNKYWYILLLWRSSWGKVENEKIKMEKMKKNEKRYNKKKIMWLHVSVFKTKERKMKNIIMN